MNGSNLPPFAERGRRILSFSEFRISHENPKKVDFGTVSFNRELWFFRLIVDFEARICRIKVHLNLELSRLLMSMKPLLQGRCKLLRIFFFLF